ncbi:AzlC family ABC transporter permease [Lacrimispora indolis]|uniref:AzlC family ABC transporter permease n=1 Tax=Lacrimispora indolis TaxID=69825 RepID=UPI00041A3C5E|nr:MULTISPECIES: AzlC family ABC transporter permease [Lachnospiraceae]
MNTSREQLKSGIKDGIPICLGYFAVSFTFGIMALNYGLSPWQSVVISLTNLTSAGQFAGLGIITAGAPFAEMAVAQLVINLRYCLMSCSISQKLDKTTPFYHRLLISYGITDEIFGVSVCRPGPLNPWYCYGLFLPAIPGWTLGTAAGAFFGQLLPERALSALGVALYGMFLAIIIPPAKKDKVLAGVTAVSMILSLLFFLIPVLHRISSGFRLIILTVAIAGAAAFFFPVPDTTEVSHE